MKAIANKNGVEPGEIVSVSDLYENDVASYKGKKFIVTKHIAEDRASGETVVTYESGIVHTFGWDFEDPKVTYLGKGKISIEF